MYKNLIIFEIIFIICAGVAFASSIDEANKLNEEGDKLYDQSDYKGALAKYEEALRIYKENGDKKDIVIVLTNIGLDYRNLGDYPKALEYDNKALEIDRKIGNVKGEGIDLGNIGTVYSDLCDYPKALEYYNQALEIARKTGDIESEGKWVGCIGFIYYYLCDYPKTLGYYNQALEIARKIKDVKDEGIWLGNIGTVYDEAGDYLKALEYYNKALEIDRKIGDVKGEEMDLGNIGNVYYFSGDYPKAIEYDNKTLEIARKIGDVNSEGRCLGNIGIVYRNLGDYPKALEYYYKALKIFRKIGDVKGEGSQLGSIGIVYDELGDYPKALEYYNKALEIARKIGDIKGEGSQLGNIGIVYDELGDYPKALEYYYKALEINKKIGVPYDLVERNIGDVYFEQGNLDKAFEIYNKLGWSIPLGRYYLARKDYTKAKEKFIGKLEEAEKQRNAENLLSIYIGLGLSEEGLKNYSEAEKYYKKAVDFIEHQRDSLPQSARKNFFEGKLNGFSKLEPYEGLCRVYHYLNRDGDSFFYSECTKARVLAEEIAQKYEGTAFNLPVEITDKERKIINSIASIYKQMDVAYEKNNQERLKELEKDLEPLKKEQETFISELRKNYPEYASIMYPKPFRVEEIKLKQNEVIIEYEVTNSETIACLIKNNKIVKTISMSVTKDELSSLVKDYRGSFENVTSYSALGKFKPQTGKKLYDLLLKDLLHEVKGEKIIIIPDKILGILPFEALICEMPVGVKMKEGKFGPVPEGVKYVADLYNISYYQSAGALTIIRNLNKGTGKKGLFAIGDPVFNKKDERVAGQTQTAVTGDFIISMQSAMESEGIIVFDRLPGTGELVKELTSVFPGDITSLTGIDAKEENVKNKNLSDYRYILFATHGILDNDVPYIKEPALVLCQIDKKGEDGFLTMGEVMNMKMNADVAVLSACKTGLGENVSGDGVMGMGRAFQYAGVKTVLMSLWSVEERSTNTMIEKYFEKLKEGKSNMEALREARVYIRKEGYEHPFFWGPFIMVGE